jgi:hypothetical protein
VQRALAVALTGTAWVGVTLAGLAWIRRRDEGRAS